MTDTYLSNLRANLIKWGYECAKHDDNSVLIKDVCECDVYDVLMASAKALDELQDYRSGMDLSTQWETDITHLEGDRIPYDVWVAWDHGCVDLCEAGAIVDFTGCIGWIKAEVPTFPTGLRR